MPIKNEDKKLKILYLITKGNFGGAQRYVYELATSLPQNQFEVSVLLGEGEALEKKLKEKKVRVIKVKELARDINFAKDWKAFTTLLNILRSEKPDIIHLNSSKIGLLGAVAGRLAGVKKIFFTGHGWAFNENRPAWQKKIFSCLHWLTIILCHKTILVAESLKKQISGWPGVSNKIAVVHNGIQPTKLYEKESSRRILLPNHKDKFWVGTIAELHPNKGLDFLIESFSQVVRSLLSTSIGWSLVLVIIGEGQERERLEKLIAEKKLKERIFLLGHVDEARRYLKAFDIFVLPSRTEAFPYVPLEAGLAEVPVLASDVGGLPEIIPDAEYGLLVPPGDVAEITKSLKYLVNKEAYRKLASSNLKKRVIQEFSLSKMVEETISLYSL